MSGMSTPMNRLATIVAGLAGKTITECSLVSSFTDSDWPASLFLSTSDGDRVRVDVGMIDILTSNGEIVCGMDERHAEIFRFAAELGQ